MSSYTIVEYRYSDYSNWKFYGSFSLSGKFNWDAAKPFLFEDAQFIPREVGLDSLTPKEMNEDDHWLHEIVSATIVSEYENKPLMTSAEFVRRIKKASSIGWLELCPWV